MRPLLVSIFLIILPATLSAQAEDDDDLEVIELAGFEVFSNSMKIVDGITGKDYEGKHPVVLSFRREFDNLLLKFHKRLLYEEHKKLKRHAENYAPMRSKLNELAASFGFDGEIEIQGRRLTREFSIFRRMVKDPFFNIDELVVWDLNSLKLRDNLLPKNKYAKNIRLNPETGEWERRILTKWEVSYLRSTKNGPRRFYTYKEQGFNLETNRGFHLIDIGLPGDVSPAAFKDVKLQYPIFVDTAINVDEQVKELSRDFIENLFYIYDPFSWVARGNTRFPYGFPREIDALVKKQELSVSDRAWFNRVLATFLNDVTLLEHWSPDVIYAQRMASTSPKNKNILGEDLDLLNWHKREKRRVNYDPAVPYSVPRIGFNNAGQARYILLDAYRRYGDKFVEALRSRVLAIPEEGAEGKGIVRQALAEVSGIPADKYIPAAIRAQKAELQRFLAD